jgi:hypothetical protein
MHVLCNWVMDDHYDLNGAGALPCLTEETLTDDIAARTLNTLSGEMSNTQLLQLASAEWVRQTSSVLVNY